MLGVRRLHQDASATDLDGVGVGLPWPIVDDGVSHGGACSYGSLGFASFVPYEESRKHPVGACKGSVMYFVDIILIMKWCKCTRYSGLAPPF